MPIHLSEAQIKTIVDELDCGQKCYVHTQTGELICYPDPSQFPVEEDDTWQEDMRKVAQHPEAYREIEPMDSRESFRVMQAFADGVAPPALQARLHQALSRPSPFRNFKREIDQAGAYRQEWFNFRQERMREWVRSQRVVSRQS